MAPPDEYTVQLDVFEGPLDLLLYLIKKNEVDVYDIPIEPITRQYMDYLRLMQMLDLNIAGEFIVMSATLMMIKSRMLLPVEDRADDQEEEEDDPRSDLVRQLVEYKKFKDAAGFLGECEDYRQHVFAREGEGVNLGPPADMELRDVGIFDLIAAFNEALRNIREEALPDIVADQYTVAEKIDSLMAGMRSGKPLSLTGLLRGMKHRAEMVCLFLAVLELMKLKQVQTRQEGLFGEIVLMPGDEVDGATPDEAVLSENHDEIE